MASSSSPSPSPPPRPLSLPPPPHSSSSSPESKRLLLPPPGSKPLSPPKRSPPLPWTHQETLALIQAYQEKWYSLKKGQLKAFQWDEVAANVAARCGFDEPSKTSTQCRHKIEKLRKRYRSELQKPYPNSWQYFELMDQMERGPMPLNALPIAVVKSSSNNANSNSNCSNHGYGSLYSSSADYYSYHNNINNSGGDSGGSDESEEKWNSVHGIEAATRNKANSVNNIARRGGNSGVRITNRDLMERGFGGNGNSVVRALRNPLNEKRKKQYYDGDDSEDDDDDDDGDDDEDDVEEGGEKGGGGAEIAAKIRGFADSFMKMEDKKIEMMRETEMHRMEMEKKRTEMILEAQRKLIDTIGRAFGANKKAKMAQET
ncbi:Transcription factor GT-2 [Handroanthus impetiginosus]|uniref:Transcription factor GT-2 n=1 Tax=Handroanthus impetiginosus TaxID=429701 RepID=A0A2G9G4T7_9LAMI|nr:Transcription factor GT-2 [Handroanthus impetiginosus]